MAQIEVGMPVADALGTIGVLQAIEQDTRGPDRVVVQRGTAIGIFTPRGYAVIDGVLRLDVGDDAPATSTVMPGDVAPLGPQRAEAVQVVDVAPGEELRIPVIREDVSVGTQVVDRGGVRVHKTVQVREELVEQPVVHTDVVVQRVPVGRVVAAVPPARTEGDTLILPVLEEQVVVEKRLVLKEEVHILRRQTQTTDQMRVTLRAEQIHLEELDDTAGERPRGAA